MRNFQKLLGAVIAIAWFSTLTAQAQLYTERFTPERVEAERQLGGLLVQDTPATIYLWANKYVYTVGEALELRWTINPNSDLYPYTFFVYRQNTNSGEKLYLPNLTPAVTDIFGRGAGEFTIQRIPTAAKQVLVGASGQFPASPTAPNTVGSYQYVAEIRDYTGTRVVRAAYAKFGVVATTVNVPAGDITADTTWSSGNAYRITGSVFVMAPATLTIEPGTFILGQGQTAFLAITQGAKINACGTRARPIVFSSTLPVGQRSAGDWGGLVINGRATINQPGGTALSEGIDDPVRGTFGGTDDNDNSGALCYVRVEFGGVQFTTENELNGIAFQGVGRGTTVHHIQTHYGSDDGVEFFGGTVDAKYVISSSMNDDLIDWTWGWRGRVQFAIGRQNAQVGADNGFEADNNSNNHDLLPRSRPVFYNVTMVGDPVNSSLGSDDGVEARVGTGADINNLIVLGFGENGVDLTDDSTFTQGTNGNFRMRSTILWDNAAGNQTFDGQFASDTLAFGQAQTNLRVVDPKLRKPFDLNDPDYRPADGSATGTVGQVQTPPDDGFFDTSVGFIGAMGDEDWTEEWTNFLEEADVAP
jgi:hypothetical protein